MSLAALTLLAQHGLDWHEIDSVVVQGGDHLRTFSEPVESRRRPANPATAANSVFFAVAKALVNGEVVLEQGEHVGGYAGRVLRSGPDLRQR